MFTALSPRYRAQVRFALAASWLFSACAGAVAVIGTPSHVVDDWGPLRYVWAGSLVVAGVVAASGVIFNKYRWEWGAAWFASAAATPYAMGIWVLSFYGEPDRMTGAFFLTSLIAMTITRALLCAAHAEKLRTATTETIPYVPGP